MKLKDRTVNVRGLNGSFWPKLFELDWYWRRTVGYELVLTSVRDGVHSDGSKHYIGEAVDIRTWATEYGGHQLHGTRRAIMHTETLNIMGEAFIVLDEHDHFHIQTRGTNNV
jgi:hypothetical protein